MQPLIVENLPTQDTGHQLKLYEKDGFNLPWHMHDSYELTLIQRGTGQRIVGSHIAPFGPGDMVLLAPNLPHAWKNRRGDDQSSVRAITLKLAAGHPLFQLIQRQEMLPVRRILEASTLGLQLRGSLNREIECTLEKLTNQPDHRQLAGILDILVRISDSTEVCTLLPGSDISYSARESGNTRKVIDYIFEHYTNKLDADTLATIAGVHTASLGRMFKRTTGITPTEFINQVRINRACQLLQENELPIVDISLRCGFENLSWFNRVFKQLQGCTPREFRRTLSQAKLNSDGR